METYHVTVETISTFETEVTAASEEEAKQKALLRAADPNIIWWDNGTFVAECYTEKALQEWRQNQAYATQMKEKAGRKIS